MPGSGFSHLWISGYWNSGWNNPLGAVQVAVFVLLLVISGVAQAGESSAAQILTRLYWDFAWRAVTVGSPGAFVADQPKPMLEKYFTPQLADALVADYACRVRTREICGLDFMLLWDSQDVVAEDLSIVQDRNINQVRVEYTMPSAAPEGPTKVIMRFRMEHAKLGWRVADIIYRSGVSLTSLLGNGTK